MVLTNRTVGPIHIDIDKVAPGEIPKLVRHVILGEERYSFHFDDSILWFRRDQLNELQDRIVALKDAEAQLEMFHDKEPA